MVCFPSFKKKKKKKKKKIFKQSISQLEYQKVVDRMFKCKISSNEGVCKPN